MASGSSVFIDTAPFIYMLEDNEQYSDKVRALVNEYYESDTPLFTSPLTYTEYCVVPYRSGNLQKIADFEAFISDAGISLVPLTTQIAKYAARLRSLYAGLKSMDALQLSSAIVSGCDVFLTNDKQLRQVEEIQVLLVDDL